MLASAIPIASKIKSQYHFDLNKLNWIKERVMHMITVKVPTKAIPKKTPVVVSPPEPPKIP